MLDITYLNTKNGTPIKDFYHLNMITFIMLVADQQLTEKIEIFLSL